MKDLTTSEIARQNVLNNKYALEEVQRVIGLRGIVFEEEIKFTKQQLASFFEVSERTINSCLTRNDQELRKNGYEVISGNRLKIFKLGFANAHDKEVNFLIKSNKLGIFNFRAFINLAMLLSKSERAREVRSLVLDIVIDTINKRTGGNTKYINQRDEDFIFNLLNNRDYHKEMILALRDYVDLGNIKYLLYNDKVYRSVFKEDADEYRKVLKLSNEDNERHTMYSEVLDLIASYEAGFADELRKEYLRTAVAKGGHPFKVYGVHLLRNAALQIITRTGSTLPFLFTGSLLLESFFGIPGLGFAGVEALYNSDLQLLKAIVLLSALLFGRCLRPDR